MNNFIKIFNELIEYEKKTHEDMTQVKIAAAFGFSKQKLSNLKSGYSAPSIDDLIIISTHFDVTIDFLVGKTNTEL